MARRAKPKTGSSVRCNVPVMGSDHYTALEISPRASAEVIHVAYRALAAKHHTDHGGNPAIILALNEAYSVLSDPKSKDEYDKNRTTAEGTVIGNYRVLEKIAEGGFGSTYKGEQ